MDLPFVHSLSRNGGSLPEHADVHVVRRLSGMKGQFLDDVTFEAAVNKGDPVLYEVYEWKRPEIAGELVHGLSVVHPGKIGDEYFMTKGHFHNVLETGEMYFCLRGQGFMVMETPEGEWSAHALYPDVVLYVPPRWAHRSINTGRAESLQTLYVYPGDAGHDYGSIEECGFRKLVVERDGVPAIVDNPRWVPPERRKRNPLSADGGR